MSAVAQTAESILIGGEWVEADATGTFQSHNPATCEALPEHYPVSSWSDCDKALDAAVEAAADMRSRPTADIAAFLEAYADLIDANIDSIAEIANAETGLPVKPRLAAVEGPRTSGQLRQAAAAARTGSWAMPTIDTKLNIRSVYEPIGPVCVFGPNNFPFAFNSVAGGDFAAAIAAGNPVIGKANTSHPGATRALAELARQAAEQTGMHPGIVQLIYRTSHEDGARLVADQRVGAIGYTGSRRAGLTLKAAADAVGKPIYLELSSVNPVAILPGALAQSQESIVGEFVTSVLMGTGQFCTNPGLVLMVKDANAESFIGEVEKKFAATAPGTLLSDSVKSSLSSAIKTLVDAGAKLHTGGGEIAGKCSVENTLLSAPAASFIASPEVFQTEAFGNATLVVVADDVDQLRAVIESLEGNLTGSVYSASDDTDDAAYDVIAPALAKRVGRLMNDKMPTGVAVSSAMNHGGPFPATGHPGFTAVGIPGSLLRFAKLTSYDSVRASRLPVWLQDKNPTGETYRLVDLKWTTDDVG
ncbi:MAG: aldehyde dehydrogenase (NADP(+)) [Aureliella sp.]